VKPRLRILNLVAMLLFTASASASADVPAPGPERFAADIDAFAAWDRKNAFPADGILFVGSSSVRGWATAQDFPGKPIINRGFGGSELSDIIHYYERVIRPYAPAKIFVYAGDNDIGRGKSATQVVADYKTLARLVQNDFPGTQFIFISIKPSIARWDKWPAMVEANRMVEAYAARHENLGYADLATPLLDDNGLPGPVFADDGLHLNDEGYRRWRVALAPYLD
jgi:lysophospholipase L1-like esterase